MADRSDAHRAGSEHETVGGIAYHIDKWCTGGDPNDWPCAKAIKEEFVDPLVAERNTLASWLETVLWHVNNPERAGEGMNIGDATRALHDFDPEAARRVNPGLASLYDKVKAS